MTYKRGYIIHAALEMARHGGVTNSALCERFGIDSTRAASILQGVQRYKGVKVIQRNHATGGKYNLLYTSAKPPKDGAAVTETEAQRESRLWRLAIFGASA